MIPRTQSQAAAFLEGLGGRPPVETHISAVFVGQETAWKLKKAVALPFLDFTAPDRRRHFVLHEFALNHGMAPELYRTVRGIARAPDGSLRFCAAEAPEAIEWVLEMAAIPAGDFLDSVTLRGGLTPDLCRALGDLTARLHQSAPIRQVPDAARRMGKLIDDMAENAPGAGLEGSAAAQWQEAMRTQLRAQAALLETRAREGRVRRLHGDLHLGNLCLWRGAVLPFDALEFDEDLATIDTGYDLAFLLMDLDLRAGRAAANAVFNRYLALCGDLAVLKLLPLFLSQRAMIRAYVYALQNDARRQTYFCAALAYLRPAPSPLIAIGGLQGTGKSTLARALAPVIGPAPGALVLRSDELRKRLNHVAPEIRLPSDAYNQAANAELNAALAREAAAAASSLHGVMVDASFLSAPLRVAMEDVARQAGRPFLGLWLEAKLAVLEDRLARRRNDASDAGPEVLRQAALADPGPLTWRRLDATDQARLQDQALELIRTLSIA